MKVEEAVKVLLAHVGEDPNRPGVLDTPARVAKSLQELCKGYQADPGQILSRQFDMDDSEGASCYQGIVILRDIPFNSLCEHHMLPFTGTASVAYIPPKSGKVVGISKLARLVDCFSQRLQCQERLTSQVADALVEHLEAQGVLVVVQATHQCMSLRGVSKTGSVMTTSEVRGKFQDQHEARQEALALLR